MNPRKFINFLRSRSGIIILFLVGTAVILTILISRRERMEPVDSSKATKQSDQSKASQTVTTFTNPLSKLDVPKSPDEKKARGELNKKQEPTLPPISLVAETVSTEPEPKKLSEDFAPYGRLIPCELIVTVDSSSIRTPMIGLITEDVYHHGRLVIPAGTEVHGKAQVDRARERIASDGQWTLVWQSGEELNLSGLALDREALTEEGEWGITDGSAGLRGKLIKTDDLAEIKMFAATLLSGAADAFTDRRDTPFGSVALPSLQNAPLRGGQKVLDRYAEQIFRTIERDGFYVRVPAGKQFYLYVTQTIDKADATLGGTTLQARAAEPPQKVSSQPAYRTTQPTVITP